MWYQEASWNTSIIISHLINGTYLTISTADLKGCGMENIMKDRHNNPTSYKRAGAACGLTLIAVLLITCLAASGYLNTSKAAPGDNEHEASQDLQDGKLTQEAYEKLVESDYKESGGMVRFGNYRRRHDVNRTTLFVGTYLIEFTALNETYYRLANISKTQHKQDIELYKSEIASAYEGAGEDDVWAALSGADLSSLTTGARTEESSLDGYWISCVINDDGAFDPMTGEKKDLTGDDLYDLLSLPELAPLKNQYDEIEQKAGRTDNEARHNYYTRNMLVAIDGEAESTDTYDNAVSDREMFGLYENNGRNDITNRCDIEINALKAFYNKYDGGDEMTASKASIILDLYARQDAMRRTEIYKFLAVDSEEKSAALNALTGLLEKRASSDGEFTLDEDYKAAITQSISNCKESYELYSTMLLSPGSTVISEFRYDQSNMILDSAYNNRLESGVETRLVNIVADNNIGAGEIKISDAEQEVLQTYLVPEGIRRYENKVLTEVSSDYTSALVKGESEAVKKDILMAQYDEAVKQMQELEFLVKSTCDRKDKEYAIDFVKEQIELATLWKTLVFDDPYGPLADYCIDLYIEWLNNLYKDILDGDSDSDIDGLDPDDLDEARKRAEDENDLEKLRQLDALEGEYGINKGSDDDDRNGGEGDDGPGVFSYSVSNMTPKDLLTDLGNRLDDDLKKGNYSIYDAVTRGSADAGFDPDDIVPGGYNNGSNDSNNRNKSGTGTDDDSGRDNTAGSGSDPAADGKNRKDRRDNENYGRNYGGGDEEGDSGNKSWGDISAYAKELDSDKDTGENEDRSDEDIDKAIEKALGKSFGELDPEAQAAVVVALNRYGKMHNAKNCLDYARRMLTVIMNNKNPLVYAVYEDDSDNEYINLGAVDRSRSYTGFRYVYIDGVDTVTQTTGTASYSFIDKRVTDSGGNTKDLTSPVGYQTDDYVKSGTRFPYINETDAMKYMVESGEYIVDTDWGIVVTAAMELQVSKIIEQLTQAEDNQ